MLRFDQGLNCDGHRSRLWLLLWLVARFQPAQDVCHGIVDIDMAL